MLDFIGIGLGPFNLSLASLLQNKSALNYVFFEQKAQFDWHAGMQLPNTILQVPFMADLVSMVDPTNPFSFLNYLRHQQRLYKFYFLEQPHIPRCEYNHYCRWVAEQLDCIEYQSRVLKIEPQTIGFKVVVESQGVQQSYLCRHLVIGSGNVPYLPECLAKVQQQQPKQCLHSAQYMTHADADLHGDIVVLGSGQSAAEVFIDLFDEQQDKSRHQFDLHWFTRSQGFFPMEYAPLGLEHFSPDYAQHFYELPVEQKDQQLQQQALLYKGISAKTIREIYQKLYHRSIAGQRLQTHLHSQCELKDAEVLDTQKIRLYFQHRATAQAFHLDCDFLVAATGYFTPDFEFMQLLKPYIEFDHKQRWKITEDYRVVHHLNGNIFVQNQEMHSHGVGTPDLGLGAYRAATIINQLLGEQLYDLGQQEKTFQHFNLSQNPKICLADENVRSDDCLGEKVSSKNHLILKKTEQGVLIAHSSSRCSNKRTQTTSAHPTYEKLI
ncbi:SidA/IucD/PvdA family monooxygenase [Acinetobacter sp. NIPH 1852]|uniref:lysine N(6)-hydroxylase/L-ornithine N(5)-oxygenase family protein n=1 Tax=Acinetobacter sp. NIPH 1852 TaxID=2923428 RepID=UPI001B436959|nr:SidA/IucD/PvdA family monooxygenase [Acinetobacter sp. NIPH 1852]MBP7879870.1 SidA/IucD/PvdA family monooxygenase [Acinetobacter sp.]MCH7306979.1 SidA/IucD/PvdA family monooxygenase [Acinetobacter sp. NIPH 1852]